jgi:hypothetical protein
LATAGLKSGAPASIHFLRTAASSSDNCGTGLPSSSLGGMSPLLIFLTSLEPAASPGTIFLRATSCGTLRM